MPPTSPARLLPIGNIPLPANEGQARELVGLSTETAAPDRRITPDRGQRPGAAGVRRRTGKLSSLVSKLDTRVGADGVAQPASKPTRAAEFDVDLADDEPVLSQEDCVALDDAESDELAEKIAAELAASDRDYAVRATECREDWEARGETALDRLEEIVSQPPRITVPVTAMDLLG